MSEEKNEKKRYLVTKVLYRDEEHERSVSLGFFDSHEEAVKFVRKLHGKETYEINEVGGTRLLSYPDRLTMLKNRGFDTRLLLTDWCVSCKFSSRIIDRPGGSVCGTGCNGIVPFNTNGEFFGIDHAQRLKPCTLREGKEIVVKNMPVPIGYEEEIGVEI